MRHFKTQLPSLLDPQQCAYHPNRCKDDFMVITLYLALTHLEKQDTYVEMFS